MIYITGDKHGDYSDIINFCFKYKTRIKDIMIILGDAGINYFLDGRDYALKEILSRLPITFFCIHGNHEERPYNIKTYNTKQFHNGKVYYEVKYPNILFASDGEIYNLNKKKALVIGGAYSIDKDFRLKNGYKWYPSEQPDEKIKKYIKDVVKQSNKINAVFSHTCPFKYMPYEAFIQGIDQSKVDNSTEKFLDEIESNLDYDEWYCGHYHIDKKIKKLRFMMNDIIEYK